MKNWDISKCENLGVYLTNVKNYLSFTSLSVSQYKDSECKSFDKLEESIIFALYIS